MPKTLKRAIDKMRGDIPRSRYISKILKQQITRQKENESGDRNVRSQQSEPMGRPRRSSATPHSHIPEIGFPYG